MASATSGHIAVIPAEETDPGGSLDDSVPPEAWFDRSSITADVMVTIEGVSEADWWRHAPEGRVCEYLDGVVYMPSPASDQHQEDVGFWFFLLKGFASQKKVGRVVLGPGVLRLASGRNPEPDVFLVPPGEGPHVPPALLIVETLSKSTRAHDTGRKADGFREAQIPEIVYVDLERHRLIVMRRCDDLYTTEIIEQGVWRSVAIPGFWIHVDWLWQDPQPDPLACLGDILAGLPA